MSSLRRDVQQFHDRAINSIRLAIECFNRPIDQGRSEAVLHFALHAHEMLAKSMLLHRRRAIQDRRDSKTISFERCLNLLDGSGEKILDENDRISLTALSNVRDAAQHSVVMLSEQELFLHAQAAVTVFDRALRKAFQQRLADFLPTRVLPISTQPPMSMKLLIDKEASQIRDLLQPGRRRTSEATARLRSILAMDLAAAGTHRGPTPLEVTRAANRLRGGRRWTSVFPNLAGLQLESSGAGQTYSVRLTRSPDGLPARFADTEDEAGGAAIIREVNYFDKYNIKLTEFGKRLGVTQTQGYALIYYLGLKDDPETFYLRRTSAGSVQFQGLTHLALIRAREALADGLDVTEAMIAWKARP